MNNCSSWYLCAEVIAGAFNLEAILDLIHYVLTAVFAFFTPPSSSLPPPVSPRSNSPPLYISSKAEKVSQGCQLNIDSIT